MKKLGIIGAVICTIFVVSFFVSRNMKNCSVRFGDKIWNIELATKPKEFALGLMYRENLCDTCSMLFVFNSQAPRNFWMKNTLIPLDMYFYDSRGELVDMAQNMRPESETEYPMDYISQPAQFVMEVNAGSQLFDPEEFDPRECLSKDYILSPLFSRLDE